MDIIYDVLAHPHHAPSLVELDHSNKFTEPSDVRFHASILVEYGILERVTYDGDDAPESAPRTFYTLTDDGWSVVRLFNEQFSPEVYESLSERFKEVVAEAPPTVVQAVDAPRPSPGSSEGDV